MGKHKTKETPVEKFRPQRREKRKREADNNEKKRIKDTVDA
jgi:hypothetical protein